ncbi:MAG: hypothetical protein ACYDEY_12670, partial [Acidimicrobiales bacterium]
MRETDGFRHVGVVDQRILLFAQMSARWWSSAAEPDRSARVEVMATESPHKASSARVSTSRHGQSGGERSMGRPDRLNRPGNCGDSFVWKEKRNVHAKEEAHAAGERTEGDYPAEVPR